MSKIITPKFRVNWPSITKPKLNELSGKEEYSLIAIFEPGTDLKPLQKAVEEAIMDKWGKDKTKWPKNMRLPFRKGEEAKKESEDGMSYYPAGYSEKVVWIRLKSVQRPGLVGPDMQDIIDDSEFYSGCYARASVNAYAYDQAGNRGVAFGLNNIQKLAEGEPLSGRPKPQDEFSAVETDTGDTASSLLN